MRDRAHDDAMADLFCEDPKLAAQTLNDILEDGDQAELLVALRQMAKAFGGLSKVAEQAELNPTQLYRTLSPSGNPTVSSLSSVLKAMGLRLAVEPIAGHGR
ncbi:MAG: addiction module antidote protein [Hyphomonas sp.]|jgi:probable addiction module antidote protein|nr:addiction module antidote protein [Hyphomonas sp.]